MSGRLKSSWHRLAARTEGAELRLFLAYATLTLRPGAPAPKVPKMASIEAKPIPTDWTNEEYKLFIEEARIDSSTQQADKRDIRARAQVVLTTSILLAGVATTSYASKPNLCWRGDLTYAIAGVALIFTVLAAGGLISARSDIGAVSIPALTHYNTGELQQIVADGYAQTRRLGAETIAVMVTVLRDCVLTLVVAAGLVAIAHVVF